MRALVVDDHDLTRKYVRELLMEECGFPEVEEAEDGVDALARLTKSMGRNLAVVSWPYMWGAVTRGDRAMASARRRGLNDSMR